MHVSSNRPVSEDEKADDVCSRRHLYCDTPVVTSWAVAGQQVVFLHMYLQTRVTLEAFPVATPRGRSSSSHEGEHVNYDRAKADMSLMLHLAAECLTALSS